MKQKKSSAQFEELKVRTKIVKKREAFGYCNALHLLLNQIGFPGQTSHKSSASFEKDRGATRRLIFSFPLPKEVFH